MLFTQILFMHYVTNCVYPYLGDGNSEQLPELAALIDRGRELQIPKATLELSR